MGLVYRVGPEDILGSADAVAGTGVFVLGLEAQEGAEPVVVCRRERSGPVERRCHAFAQRKTERTLVGHHWDFSRSQLVGQGQDVVRIPKDAFEGQAELGALLELAVFADDQARTCWECGLEEMLGRAHHLELSQLWLPLPLELGKPGFRAGQQD